MRFKIKLILLYLQKSLLIITGILILTSILMHKPLKHDHSQTEFIGYAVQQYRKECQRYSSKDQQLSTHSGISCSKIAKGDPEAIVQASLSALSVKNKRKLLSEDFYLNLTKTCSYFKTSRRYITQPLSKEEEDFPLAYSMVVHENIEMFERLLRAIYSPQNIYCIHVDQKSRNSFTRAVRAIATCFDNVFVASKLETIVYASWSRVQADLNCMKDLLESKVKWHYVINTCGADFPIKTNAETARMLKLLNGRNSLESEKPSAYKEGRWKFHHEVNNSIIRTEIKKSAPPIKTPVFTGNAYFVLARKFVRYLFYDPVPQQLIKWVQDTYSPDEHLWATLYRIPEAPGSVPPNMKYDATDMQAIVRLVKWEYLEGDIYKGAPYKHCTGSHRHAVCIYGSGDLNWMLHQHHLLANKFDPLVDDIVIQCLEEYLRQKALCGIDFLLQNAEEVFDSVRT
ncbi:beta-1,3-galactosyl-O-glycosyl-glycoprotein beta-1,6-N-acetylglucosaminyltransferase 3-like [Protopterus annectens]|uniref:beta-1,3-galactosyl-O-glycosyl-glycoprotein beta-1,6-N-acetylglucosaminyltransferase 3-like n=1 Tax=Protopterus annectens TaxID=7888 RepID=UPI001CFAB0CD|nr:beta-1,3-galactosyl-O-glycosyl-glycoprotein beta-1,6-N-acetylglucosaminyltransferase 3-like [Protopterus annectens]